MGACSPLFAFGCCSLPASAPVPVSVIVSCAVRTHQAIIFRRHVSFTPHHLLVLPSLASSRPPPVHCASRLNNCTLSAKNALTRHVRDGVYWGGAVTWPDDSSGYFFCFDAVDAVCNQWQGNLFEGWYSATCVVVVVVVVPPMHACHVAANRTQISPARAPALCLNG
jgi:hypothetical protein